MNRKRTSPFLSYYRIIKIANVITVNEIKGSLEQLKMKKELKVFNKVKIVHMN